MGRGWFGGKGEGERGWENGKGKGAEERGEAVVRLELKERYIIKGLSR